MAKQPKYEWMNKYHAKGDANVVGRRLDKIAEKHETDTAPPQAIVDDATPEGSPLHNFFTWDDSVAGPKYRLVEARDLAASIRRVSVIQTPQGEEPKLVRAFVSVRAENGERGYVTTIKALSDPELHRQMVEDALKGLKSWMARYNELKELGPIRDAIHQVEEELNGVLV